MGFQPAASEVARRLQWLDGMILVIITLITLFVTGLLAWVVIRYNRKSQPRTCGLYPQHPDRGRVDYHSYRDSGLHRLVFAAHSVLRTGNS